jgi:hypothetical protein
MYKRIIFVTAMILIVAATVVPQDGGQSGTATGEARVYTTRRTVGIVDAAAPKVFEDVTSQTVLKNFLQTGGDKLKNYIPEGTSGAVAILDYNNDGKPDIFLLNGGSINAINGKDKMPGSALYRNLGNWKFEDVTKKRV